MGHLSIIRLLLIKNKMSTAKFIFRGIVVALLVVGSLFISNYLGVFDDLVAVPSGEVSSQFFRVSAEASTFAKPDTATVDVSVVTEGKTVADTQEELNSLNTKVLAAIKDLDISSDDIQTTTYNIFPNYRYDSNEGESILNGYRAETTLRVRITDFDKLNSILDSATQAGANRVSNVQFIVDERDEYVAEARETAIKKAKAEAKMIADEAGIKLGKLVNIEVNEVGNGLRPVAFERATVDAEEAFGGSIAQVEAGTDEISVNVYLYYELD